MDKKDIRVGDEVTVKATVFSVNDAHHHPVTVTLADGIRDAYSYAQIDSVKRKPLAVGDIVNGDASSLTFEVLGVHGSKVWLRCRERDLVATYEAKGFVVVPK